MHVKSVAASVEHIEHGGTREELSSTSMSPNAFDALRVPRQLEMFSHSESIRGQAYMIKARCRTGPRNQPTPCF